MIPPAVAANRARLLSKLALPSDPSWLNQVHGSEVIDLDAPQAHGAAVTGDASITAAPGRVCVIMVADCLPVLFASRDGRRIGAAHAGWRGLANGVLEATVRALDVEPGTLTAWMGPAISRRTFRSGRGGARCLRRARSGGRGVFRAKPARSLAGRSRGSRPPPPRAAGRPPGGRRRMVHVRRSRSNFFSHRRDGHLHDGKGGRMAALIWKE